MLTKILDWQIKNNGNEFFAQEFSILFSILTGRTKLFRVGSYNYSDLNKAFEVGITSRGFDVHGDELEIKIRENLEERLKKNGSHLYFGPQIRRQLKESFKENPAYCAFSILDGAEGDFQSLMPFCSSFRMVEGIAKSLTWTEGKCEIKALYECEFPNDLVSYHHKQLEGKIMIYECGYIDILNREASERERRLVAGSQEIIRKENKGKPNRKTNCFCSLVEKIPPNYIVSVTYYNNETAEIIGKRMNPNFNPNLRIGCFQKKKN